MHLIQFCAFSVPADDLKASKESFSNRRARLIENAVSMFREHLEQSIGNGELLKGWGATSRKQPENTRRD